MKKFILSLLMVSSFACADTPTEIKEVIVENLAHTQNEDIAAAMANIHSQSPLYLSTQQVLEQLLPLYDLKYTLLEYTFIGEDEEYAYAKVKQRTSKVDGPDFKNNELEAMQVFKKEEGIWKLWTQANLSILYINSSAQ